MLGAQFAAFGQMHGPLHRALKLADVPGPAVTPDGLRRQRARTTVEAHLMPLDEVHGQRQDVLGPFAQGRHEDIERADAVEEIGPELVLKDSLLQVLVGGGDDAQVHRHGAQAADALNFPGLEHAQKLDLHIEGHVPDLVQKERARVGQLELAGPPALLRAGKGPLLIAEKFAFKQFLGDGPAVDGHKRARAAVAVVVDGLREQLLARARLAVEQHRGRAVRGDVRQMQGRKQVGARAEDGVEGKMRVRPGHLHGHAHHFLFFHHREQAAHQLAALHADGVERGKVRAAAAPGQNFPRPEPPAFLQVIRNAVALAHAVLKGLALAVGGQLQELARAVVGLHDAARRVHGDDAARVRLDERPHVLVLDRQFPQALALTQLRGDGFRRLPHQPQRVHVHHVRIAAEGNGPEDDALRGEDRRARVAELLGRGGIHAVAGQEDGDFLLQRKADGTGAEVALGPAVARDAAPPLEMLHQMGVPDHIEHVALGVGEGHTEARIPQEAVEGIDLLLGKIVELALRVDTVAELFVPEAGGLRRAVAMGIDAVAGGPLKGALNDDFKVGKAAQVAVHGLAFVTKFYSVSFYSILEPGRNKSLFRLPPDSPSSDIKITHCHVFLQFCIEWYYHFIR